MILVLKRDLEILIKPKNLSSKLSKSSPYEYRDENSVMVRKTLHFEEMYN